MPAWCGLLAAVGLAGACHHELEPPTGPRPMAAARQGLAGMLAAIPEGLERQHGFDHRQQLKQASLGASFQLVTLTRGAAAGGWRLRSLDQWRVPVVVQGQARTLITVARVNGRLVAVELGAAVLARELHAGLERLQAADGAHQRAIVRLHRQRADLLLVAPVGQPLEAGRLLPLTSARRFLGLPDEELTLDALGGRRAR